VASIFNLTVKIDLNRITSDAHRIPFSTHAMTGFGRSLPIVTTACAGQVGCKRLVSKDANGWSAAMQMSGQVHAITHTAHGLVR